MKSLQNIPTQQGTFLGFLTITSKWLQVLIWLFDENLLRQLKSWNMTKLRFVSTKSTFRYSLIENIALFFCQLIENTNSI
jgi:hypothetical protein